MLLQSDIQQFNQWRCSLPEDKIRSHRSRAQSHRIGSQLQMPMASRRPPGCSQLLSNLATDWRFPLPSSSWIWLFARRAHRIQGNIFVYQSFEDMIKRYRWTASQIKRCIDRMRSGRVLRAAFSVPMELGEDETCQPLPVRRCVHQPEIIKSHTIGILWRPHHGRLINH